MPLTRFQVRSEYSLADPELYRAADKNDPEALLEGVAMAGLVGLLRQLGDLAEFAAGIFHDLHEEVMVTASRGHGLKIRVQQLESEFPSIEKKFLSQTDHSLLLDNAGIDWHPDLQTDQNLITRGELPRCIMDSYEECRGPPRLFLLDKFDNAGAGACLKRYSDPSFFKAEVTSSGARKTDLPREKKARRNRKKGSYWKIRETPDCFSTSHAKLHQLFSEEHNCMEANVPINRVKLKKRQLNGFPFDSINGKSYMARFLETCSSDHEDSKLLESPWRLKLKSSTSSKWDSEVDELRDRDQIHMPNRQEKVLETCMKDQGEDVIEEANLNMFSKPISSDDMDIVSSNGNVVRETNNDVFTEGYRSDDVSSEIDNYVDALNSMDSEVETDTESRSKNEKGFFQGEKKRMRSNTVEEQGLQARLSDFNSIRNSSASEDATNSFKKGRSSFSYSDSPSSLPDVGRNQESATEVCDAEFGQISSVKLYESGSVLGTKSSDYLVSDGPCNGISELPCIRSGHGCASCESSLTVSTFSLSPVGAEEHLSKAQLAESNLNEAPSSFMKACLLESSGILEDDSLPLEPGEQLIQMLDGDDFMQLCSISDLAIVKKHSDDAHGEMLTTEGAEYNTYAGDFVIEKLNSSVSVSLSDEEEFHALEEQELETGSSTTSLPEWLPSPPTCGDWDDAKLDGRNGVTLTEKDTSSLTCVIDNQLVDDLPISPVHNDLNDWMSGGQNAVTSSEERADQLSSLVPSSLTGGLVESTFLETEKEAPVLEKDLGKGSIACVGAERLHNDVEVLCKECSASDALNEASSNGVHFFQLAGLKTGITPEEVESDFAIAGRNQITSLSEDPMILQEDHCGHSLQQEHLCRDGSPDQSELVPELSSSRDHTGSNDQSIAVNQPPINPQEFKMKLYDQESYEPSETEFLDRVHNLKLVEHMESHLYLGDGAKSSTIIGEDNQELEKRQPQSDISEHAEDDMHPCTSPHSKPGSLAIEAFCSQKEHFSVGSLHEDGAGSKLCDDEFQQMQIPTTGASESCIDEPSRYSSTNPLSQPTASLSSQELAGLEIESYQLSTYSSSSSLPSFDIHQELLDQQQVRPAIDFSVSDLDSLEANMKEMPPLPPLPPLQWRIGKLQHNSLASKAEILQPTVDPFSPLTADEKTEWSFPEVTAEPAHPLNPFLPSSALKDEKLLDSQFGREMVQPGLNPFSSLVSMIEDEKIRHDFLAFERGELQSSNPFLPSAIENEKPQNFSHDLGQNMLQSDPCSLAGLPLNEDANGQHSSLNLKGDVAHPWKSFLPTPNGEDEILLQVTALTSDGEDLATQQSSLNFEGDRVSFSLPIPETQDEKPQNISLKTEEQMVQPLNDLKSTLDVQDEIPKVTEDGKLQNLLPVEEKLTWQSDFYSILPEEEYWKPQGSFLKRLNRPRDPLIEAVASHDKSTLRKVGERIQPQTGSKVEERDSLLQQIRAKSFNLKPAVVTRPSIQGPKTNMKVNAILEKANAIRQALAGSDEDNDSESWSDS